MAEDDDPESARQTAIGIGEVSPRGTTGVF